MYAVGLIFDRSAAKTLPSCSHAFASVINSVIMNFHIRKKCC